MLQSNDEISTEEAVSQEGLSSDYYYWLIQGHPAMPPPRFQLCAVVNTATFLFEATRQQDKTIFKHEIFKRKFYMVAETFSALGALPLDPAGGSAPRFLL